MSVLTIARWAGWAVLLLAGSAWGQTPPSFWTANSSYGSSCGTTCHMTPPKVSSADTRSTSYPMTDVTTAQLESLAAFRSFFDTYARPNGSPMADLCGSVYVPSPPASAGYGPCSWPAGTASDVNLVRQYLMDVVDTRVSISGASATITGGSAVQSSTSTSATATVNFGRLAPSTTSGSVTFTITSGRNTALTAGTPVRSGGNTSNFNVGTLSCTTLQVNFGNSCSFTVSFSSGTVSGSKSTTLQLPFAISVAGDKVPATRYITLSGSTNAVPVANAGIDRTITAPATVSLDGIGSSDADAGDTLSYSWTLPTRPAGSSATLSNASTRTPSFSADRSGVYIARLVVSDGISSSAAATVTITANNTAPLANAGANRSVTAPVTVNLDGVASSDANGDPLTYAWTLPTRPATSAASLSNANTRTPSFTADKAGSYIASLIVNDGTVNSTASTITITAGNTAPVANAGSNRSVTAPTLVALDGIGSSDANGDPLSYSWTLTARPAGSSATLASATTRTPSFTADRAGLYTARLVVNDGSVDSAASTINITAGNTAPVANAGPAQAVQAGVVVSLSGGASSDANGDTLTYAWTLPTRPVGSAATLVGATTATPSFTTDVAGSYVASLVVNDGSANSPASTVTITATSAPVFALAGTPVQPSVQVGTSGSVTLAVTNNGNAALVLSSLALGGAQPGDYALGGSCVVGTSLAGTLAPPRSSCSIVVTFSPSTAGTRPATITIGHNDSAIGGTATVTLAGIGTTAQSPVLDTNGVSSLAFGSVAQGASATQLVTVRNANTAAGAFALTINGIALNGSNASDFMRGGSCTPTTALAGGASCTVSVTFAPLAAGARAATLAISTAEAGAANVALTGTGVALADPTLGGVPLGAFPTTLIGTTGSTTRTVSIQNPRGNPVTYAVSFGGSNAADFQLGSESCPSRSVPAGGSCSVSLRFAPAAGAAGTRSGVVQLAFTGFGSDPNPASLSAALLGDAALPAPQFSASASSLSLTAVVGASASAQLVVTNTGSAGLVLSTLALSGTSAGDFSFDAAGCVAGSTLAPSSNCTLAVVYAPTVAGSSTAALSITDNAAGSPHTVALSGTATVQPRPRLALSAASLSFDQQQVGSSGAAQPVVVQNVGDAPLNFSAFTLGGSAAGDYVRGGSCTTAAPLAVAAQCTVTLAFAPSAVGTRAASLTIASDASNGAAMVSLVGDGVPVPAPVVTLSATSGLPLEFGSQTVGGLYPARRVTLANTGNAPLALSGVAIVGSAFALTDPAPCPPTLNPGDSCTIDIAYRPATAGVDDNGTLRVASNAAGSPHSAALHGRGTAAAVPALAWTPLVSSLQFGTVQAGSVSAGQSATLKNLGPGGVRLTLLNAVGADAAAFSVVAGSCGIGDVIYEGDSCRLDIYFSPGSAGNKAASVQVVSSGSFPTDLALQGTGMGGPSPGLGLSASSLSLGTVRVGSLSVPVELTLLANGAGVVRITAMTASAGFTVQSKSCPAPPFSLQAGSDCTVTVIFNPQAAGASTGQLMVTSDASSGGAQQVALSGTGEAPADVSGGGCAIRQGGDTLADPTLWLLLLAALAGLGHRGWMRRRGQRSAARSE